MGAKRGSYAVGERRRAQIMEITERLVLEGGHLALTVAQVAEALQMSEKAVYHHFPSKDVLLVELLRWRDDRSPEASIEDPVQGLLAAVRASQSTPNLMQLYVDLSSRAADPRSPAHDYFANRYETFEQIVAERLQEQRGLGPGAARIAGKALLALADGLQARWLVSRDFDIADELDQVRVIAEVSERADAALS